MGNEKGRSFIAHSRMSLPRPLGWGAMSRYGFIFLQSIHLPLQGDSFSCICSAPQMDLPLAHGILYSLLGVSTTFLLT
jgi:hypothetical protein